MNEKIIKALFKYITSEPLFINPETRQFYGNVTEPKIKARTEVRFRLPPSNPLIKPQISVWVTITDPAPGLPITQKHLDIWDLQHRKV